MKGTEKYANQLTKLIKDENGGKFPAKLTPMVQAAARCMCMLDQIEESLVKCPLLSEEIGASGQTKQVINPLLPVHEKFLSRLQGLLYELGLSNRKAAAKVDDSAADANPFSDMVETMKGK